VDTKNTIIELFYKAWWNLWYW